jgi:hypothetical protein
MTHHSATRLHSAPGHESARIALLAAIYIPTALIAVALHRLATLSLIPAFIIAFAAWTTILVAGVLLSRRSHQTHQDGTH